VSGSVGSQTTTVVRQLDGTSMYPLGGTVLTSRWGQRGVIVPSLRSRLDAGVVFEGSWSDVPPEVIDLFRAGMTWMGLVRLGERSKGAD